MRSQLKIFGSIALGCVVLVGTLLIFKPPGETEEVIPTRSTVRKTPRLSSQPLRSEKSTRTKPLAPRESAAPETDWIQDELARLESRDPEEFLARIKDRISTLTADEAPDAFAFLVTVSKKEAIPNTIWFSFLERWGEIDPVAAISQASEFMPKFQFSDRATKHIFVGFARSDPQVAAQYALDHPEVPQRWGVIEGLSVGWGEQDGQAATDWAFANLGERELVGALFGIQWGVTRVGGFEGGLEWFDNLPDDAPKSGPYRALADRFSRKPESTIDELVGVAEIGMESGLQSRGLLHRIGGELATTDPERGAELFERVLSQQGPEAYPVLQRFARQWAENDPDAAIGWVNVHSAQPWADELIRQISEESVAGEGQD